MRVSDLGTSGGWASQGSSPFPQLLLVKVLPLLPCHVPDSLKHILDPSRVLPRTDPTVLSGSEMSLLSSF